MIWQVKKTECYPNCWKVYPTIKYQESNEGRNYFSRYEDATMEATIRNKEENS